MWLSRSIQRSPGSASNVMPHGARLGLTMAIPFSEDYYDQVIHALGHELDPNQMFKTSSGDMTFRSILDTEDAALQSLFPITPMESIA